MKRSAVRWALAEALPLTTDVFNQIPEDQVDAFMEGLKDSAALRIVQRRNSDGTFRISVFRDTCFDLFISYATEDFDLCVADFVKHLWRYGVTSIWLDRMSIDVSESIPKKVDEGLLQSKYMLCILTDNYFNKFWTREELDAVRMQRKRIIPIWVDTNFKAVSAFSPTLADKKAIIYDGDADHAMPVVARVLLEDTSTMFYDAKEERREREVFWGLVWLYIRSAIGILDKKVGRKMSALNADVTWRKHIEVELGIDRRSIATAAKQHDDLSDEDKAYFILALLKRDPNGWFPSTDEELRVLERKGVSDW